MSILIKGIDMPKDIDELRLIINGMSIAIEPTKAIQIPTPHGRLIEEHYAGELQAKGAEGLFIIYRSADKDTDRFILEAEE